jgi:hypothetical protein
VRSTCHFINLFRATTRVDLKELSFRKLLRMTLSAFRRKHQECLSASSRLIRLAFADEVPIFLSNKRRTRDDLFRRRWLLGPLVLRTFPVLVI